MTLKPGVWELGEVCWVDGLSLVERRGSDNSCLMWSPILRLITSPFVETPLGSSILLIKKWSAVLFKDRHRALELPFGRLALFSWLRLEIFAACFSLNFFTMTLAANTLDQAPLVPILLALHKRFHFLVMIFLDLIALLMARGSFFLRGWGLFPIIEFPAILGMLMSWE